MFRHKKSLAPIVIVVACGAALVFWPRDNPEARRLLDSLRALAEVAGEEPPPADPDEHIDLTIHIECEIIVAKINVTDATAGLFLPSHQAKLTAARLPSWPDAMELLDKLRAQGLVDVVREPRISAVAGQTASISPEGRVRMAGMLADCDVGTSLSVRTRVAPDGGLWLKTECGLSRCLGTRTADTPHGPVVEPQVESLDGSAEIHLQSGQALLMAGLTQKDTLVTQWKLPALGDLPGIGGWFRFTQRRIIDQELIVLVRPVVHKHMRRDGPPSPPISAVAKVR
jgi:type II secretory pathway component GspD/PulD (secretin)